MSDKKNLLENWLNEQQMPLLPTTALVIPMVDLLPPNPFEKPGEKIVIDLLDYPQSIMDLLNNEEEDLKEEESDEQEQSPVVLAKAVHDFYENPTAFGEEVFKQGSASPIRIKSHPQTSDLLLAARNGDLNEITRLLKAGVNVNSEDHLSSTPFHLACMFGKTEAAVLLIRHGANLNDLSYDGFTALQLAVNHGRYQTVAALVAQGLVDATKNTVKGTTPLNMLFDTFIQKMTSPELANKTPKTMDDINQIVDAIETISQHCGKYCHYSSSFIAQNAAGVQSTQHYHFPISMQLKIYAGYAPTTELRSKILQVADQIYQFDKSETAFINAKNLLNVFPTGQLYHVKISPTDRIIVKADGHFKLYTTDLAKRSLTAYTQKLHADKADAIKTVVFERLKEIYENAHEFLKKMGDEAAIAHYFDLYEQGKTILIPSGWDGHFVTLFASKAQTVVGVGNSGDRYVGNQSGVTFYQTKDKLDPAFIKELAFNQSKQHFEHDKMYQYGLIKEIGTIAMQEQKYGNCTWESHRDAIEGMILIELLNIDRGMKNAIPTAHQYFDEWDHFQGHFQLQEYLNGDAILPAKALIDIFSEVHQKAGQGKFTEHEQAYAKKLVEALVSPAYSAEFKVWLKDSSYNQTGTQLKQLFKNYGLDVTENTVHATKLTDAHVNEAFTQFKALNKIGLETQSAPHHEHQAGEENHAICPLPTSMENLMPGIDQTLVEMI
ncbi:MAG: ankyrin repeat domain-containing protein [Candidatus Berkiella sp.]